MRDADAEAVIGLWHAAGVSRPWNDPRKDLALARRGAHAAVLVAEAEGRILATCMVGEDGHRGWVYYVAVDPGCRGQGYGRAIMAAAERWLVARGVWKMQLLVRADNAAVQDFYAHLGFGESRTVCLQKWIGEEEPGSD
ncbi:ribosomal protein S18 acetylase RimI-like enzyme [Methylobacterium sp. BE186]|uniref:GNAT family acetyltransferase n=1 Tax=Methylobacterium sp. BE186 TaxID=2817715 RepID=UPI00285EA03C|nr:GNAT family acetyltransferase [Methylobacterium sp. BE186]MDR7039824.1 ribosomal protein S18 acetylase RimI-like enzyme [Methylobacterium sp. BE186]